MKQKGMYNGIVSQERKDCYLEAMKELLFFKKATAYIKSC